MKKRYQYSTGAAGDNFGTDTSGMLGGILRASTQRLGSLGLAQSFDRDEFIAILNKPEEKREPDNALLRRVKLQPSVSEILRPWVDEWLDSGRSKDGVDDPQERNFSMAENASLAAYEYSTRGRIHLIGIENSLEVSFDEYEKSNRKPRLLFGPRSEDISREKLVFFLLSDLRFKLAKCRKDGCGRYFVLKHWNRHYKLGTLCDTHQRSRSLESAVKATADSRRNAAKALHGLAAEKFANQITAAPNWPIDAKLKEKVVLYLNDEIHRSDSLKAVYRDGITGKWLARSENWKAMVLEARKLNKKSTERK